MNWSTLKFKVITLHILIIPLLMHAPIIFRYIDIITNNLTVDTMIYARVNHLATLSMEIVNTGNTLLSFMILNLLF